jgi:hypothetical protein
MEPDELDDLDLKQNDATAELSEGCELWDKRLDESQKAWHAFCLFRNSEKRSFKSVADQLNCSPQNVFQWSSRFSWRERAHAWDVEQDRLQREELLRARTRMRARHLRLAVALQGIASFALREWQEKIEQKLPLNLRPDEIALLTKCGVELERSVTGLADVEGRHVQIIVNLGDAPEEPDEMDVLRDDTTGEDEKLLESGPFGSLSPLVKKPN